MKLIKTTVFSGIITFIKILTGFISNKLVAIFVGPSGVAVLGQFVNFFILISNISNGAINTGVVKYTAEYQNDNENFKRLINTALVITITCSLVTSFVLIFFSTIISKYLFNTLFYARPVFYIGITTLFYSLNSLILSILNGKNEIKKYTLINTLGSIIGLLLTLILVYYFNIIGAIYSLVFAQSIVFIFTIKLISKESWFNFEFIRFKFDKNISKKLSQYSLMTLVSSITLPVSQILLRNLITQKFGINDAGIWQGMMRISDGYLLLITTSLSVYYLPKLSSINNDKFKLKQEIYSGYKLIIPFLIISELLIFLFRFDIIKLLFTNSFYRMSTLFFWQLLGDFLKIISWVLSYLILAKSMTKIFIFSELFFSITYVLLGYLFTKYFDFTGIAIAFCINYLFYLLFMLYIFRDILFHSYYIKKPFTKI